MASDTDYSDIGSGPAFKPRGAGERDTNTFIDKVGMGITGEVQYDPRAAGADWEQTLKAAAAGQGPSAAQAQLLAGRDQAMQGAQSMAASARGGAGARAAAQRASVFGGTMASQQAANQAAVLRAQEQQAAMRMTSDYLTAQQQQMSNIAIQEAANKQKAFGGIAAAGAGMLMASDIRAKESVMPLASMDAGVLGQTYEPMASPAAPQAAAGGGGGGGGGMLDSIPIISDKRAKEALREGLSAGLQAAAGASGAGMPTLARAPRMPRPAITVNPNEPAPIVYSTAPMPPVPMAELAARTARARAADPSIGGAMQQAPPRVTGLIPSDERAKELEAELASIKGQMGSTAAYPDVKQSAAEAARVGLAPIVPSQFRYKPEAAAAYGQDTEPRVGFMAQDALKSPVYAPTVVQGPDGMLAIDRDKLDQANTAMLGASADRDTEMERRIAALESMSQTAERSAKKPTKKRFPSPSVIQPDL